MMMTPENSIEQLKNQKPVHAIVHDIGSTDINYLNQEVLNNDEMVMMGLSKEELPQSKKPLIKQQINATPDKHLSNRSSMNNNLQ